MLTQGKGLEEMNSSLAMRLVSLADEIGETELADKLLDHAASSAEDDLEAGWAEFEASKRNGDGVSIMIEQSAKAEQIENGQPLTAAILHHIALLYLASESFEEARLFVNRSLRIREEIADKAGRVYGLAVLSACAKSENDFSAAQSIERERLSLLEESDDKEGQMEVLADLAHAHATVGEFDQAIDHLERSLELAKELEDLSGELVARWGLADLAEISERWEDAMLQMSEVLHAFLAVNLPAPKQVRERIEKLTELNNKG